MPGHVNYATAKSGIATMTITLARELRPYDVRCNAVAPVAMTRMTQELVESGRFTEADREKLSPETVAAVVAWLASPLARDLSGQVISVAGPVCEVWDGWRNVATMQSGDHPWTIERLASSRDQLFAHRDPGVPPLEDG